MKHFFISIIAILLFAVILPSRTEAQYVSSASSAKLVPSLQIKGEDNRVKILEKYLMQYNSPLVPHAETFVMEADKNNLDWRLVVSIAGLESTFGKHIPLNSYNGWGWGIYGDNTHSFGSWDEGITTISRELRQKYMNTWGAKDIHEIGSYYASSPTWAARVTHFMNAIEAFQKKSESQTLSISL